MTTTLITTLDRAWKRAIRDEERAIERDASEASILRCTRAADRARLALSCAEQGRPLPEVKAPRTARNLGKAGLSALATLGRVIARSLARSAALVKASAGAILARAAKAARQAFRRALRTVVSLVTTKEIPVNDIITTRREITLSLDIHVITGDGHLAVYDRYGHCHKLHREGKGLQLVCKLVNDRFVFSGGTQGEHSLYADRLITDPTRLLAHWQGYCANNGLRDWEVYTVEATGEAFYKIRAHGFNWCTGESFHWHVRDLADERFDVSALSPDQLQLVGRAVAS